MTAPRWLIPVLAAVAAIAVGVAAALFAVRFAEPETVRVAPELIEVPVLAPVADDIPLEEMMGAAGDDIPVSPTVATEEVVDPDSVPDGAIPADLAGLLDDLESADDPADVMPSPGAPASDAPTGDPCADAPGDDCPEGEPGTIRALGGELPALTVWSTGANNAACPAADEAGAVRFWARVNAPVTFNLRISQGEARRQVVETTDEQLERWLDESASGEETWIEYCIEIVDLTPDVLAVVYLDATDELDRRATRALTFPMGDILTIPPTRIHPIGDSLVFVSAPHRADNATRMYVVAGDRETEPTCAYDGSPRRYLSSLRPPHTEEVSAEYLESYDYEPAYTRRTSATFAVPANTPLIVCVGWFPATDTRPTFDRDTPLRVSEYRMTSPDLVAPVVTVAELVLTEPVADGGIRLRGSTENGQRCGTWTGPPFTAGAANVVCDFGSLLGTTDAGGSLLVTTEVDTPEGLAVNNVLLDVSLLSCVDGCSGRVRSFDVELSKFIRPSRICSDDCRINVGEIAGIARLHVVWPASTAGTGEGWVLGAWREGAATPSSDPTPQLDTSGEFSVQPSGAPFDRMFRASSLIRVDRPVTVVADLVTGEHNAGLCPRPGGTTRWESSSASTAHTIEFEGLCAGTFYWARVTLTAEDGSTSVYSAESPTATNRLWIGADFSTPAQRLPLVVNDLRISTGDPDRVVFLESLRVEIGGTDVAMLRGHPEQRCWVGDIHGVKSGRSAADVGESVPIRVTASLRDASDPRTPTTPRFPTECSLTPGFAAVERLEFAGYVSYDDFIAGPTVTITDPDTGYSMQIRLSDDLEG